MGDFKRNEQIIMSRLDQAEKQSKGNDKKQGSMKDAVDSTEQIRQWEDHMWPVEKLEENLKTNKDKGLTQQ